MSNLKLGFGLREMPEGVTTAWGARWIFPNDMVHDRQDLKGENRDALIEWLNGGAIKAALIEARELVGRWEMFPDSDKTLVLFEDETGKIVGNPQSSHGYLYVAGWLKADAPGTHLIIESHWRGEVWEGDVVLPTTGESVEHVLEVVFRLFNRVDEGDGEKLAAIGYTLPSLSVGDHVTVFGQRWHCAPVGWELVVEEEAS
jgi:hypothetical protein